MPRDNRFVRARLLSLSVLIIDEISMVSDFGLELIEKTLAHYIGERPFRRIQMIVAGDFCQLCPVIKKGSLEDVAVRHDVYSVYSFQSSAWRRLGLTEIELTINKRASNLEWLQCLARVRRGEPIRGDLLGRIRSLTRAVGDSSIRNREEALGDLRGHAPVTEGPAVESGAEERRVSRAAHEAVKVEFALRAVGCTTVW